MCTTLLLSTADPSGSNNPVLPDVGGPSSSDIDMVEAHVNQPGTSAIILEPQESHLARGKYLDKMNSYIIIYIYIRV